jgi:GntR family transcriptional regulator, rspAB operon transcriptional repressor
VESSEKVHEIVYRTVRKRILSGEYPPGSKLGEINLAAEFGCSRTPIRESLKRLEHDRLLEIRPKSGTYVRPDTKADYIHLMQVRAYLESLAYRILHPKITKTGLAALERMVRQMDRQRTAAGSDKARLVELHIAFHLKMVELAGNPLLLRLYRQLNFRRSIMLYFEMDDLVFSRVQREHRRILDALAQRDPEGEILVRESIIQSMERHVAMWDEANGNGDLK